MSLGKVGNNFGDNNYYKPASGGDKKTEALAKDLSGTDAKIKSLNAKVDFAAPADVFDPMGAANDFSEEDTYYAKSNNEGFTAPGDA